GAGEEVGAGQNEGSRRNGGGAGKGRGAKASIAASRVRPIPAHHGRKRSTTRRSDAPGNYRIAALAKRCRAATTTSRFAPRGHRGKGSLDPATAKRTSRESEPTGPNRGHRRL